MEIIEEAMEDYEELIETVIERYEDCMHKLRIE